MKKSYKKIPLYSLAAVFLLAIMTFSSYAYMNYTVAKPTITTADLFKAWLPATTSDKKFDPEARYTAEDNWEEIYPNTKTIKIGELEVLASVAQSWPERIMGLSHTPYIPDMVVKLFVFDTPALHSIWMKDMNYAIDIMWVNADGEVIYLVEQATPESYPELFTPQTPALYVVEAKSGFISTHKISLGDKLILPNL